MSIELKIENPAEKTSWGRAWNASVATTLGCLFLLVSTPFTVLYFYICAFHFDCSLVSPLQMLLEGNLHFAELLTLAPPFSMNALFLFIGWVAFQVVLAIIPDQIHKILPGYQGGNIQGAVTPAGLRLWYNINGMQAWLISNVLFVLGSYLGFFSPTIIFDNWGSLFWIVNMAGFTLAFFVAFKAFFFPSHPEDRKFSGNSFYDFYMGIELNPRLGPIDLKLFFNGRPGIVAWTMINFSFASAQYMRYGYVTNSMILVNILHAIYVLYFFWKESWYLKTIDIHHDHFGWMLSWGDCVWLPFMYTLQALFLVFHPVELSFPFAAFVLCLGLLGFWIFASANNQKDQFRNSETPILIWGEEPKSIVCHYTTQDGSKRESRLLVSGWWGYARHMNYTGDLILSFAYSLACGVNYLFPYFYFIFLSILLIHRCLRDEDRCQKKYGIHWNQYCQKVPYRLIPKVW